MRQALIRVKIALPLVISLVLFHSACASPRQAPPARDSRYFLLNPLLAEESDLRFSEPRPFMYKLHARIQEFQAEKRVGHVSVYFFDLENGALRGENFEEKFTPASLLKVPVMIAALKAAETDPDFLKRRVTLGIPTTSVSYLSARALVPGTEYSLEEVLKAMIVDSDNDALILLRAALGEDIQNAVYRDFGLIIPAVRTLEDSMSVREYATFFRVLYNASYLSKEMSQKALEYLAGSHFTQGIVAGVPSGVPVAHKYGERFFPDDKKKQLHDCGVVYHPRRHYVLCVMTRGDDFEHLAGVIREISGMAYTEIEKDAKSRELRQ
jgi:beta-lactamase class A